MTQATIFYMALLSTITVLAGGCADGDCPAGLSDNGRGRCVAAKGDGDALDGSVMGIRLVSADDWSRPSGSDAGLLSDNARLSDAHVGCQRGDCEGDLPMCEEEAGVCVECLADGDCAGPDAAVCINHECSRCQENADCGDPAAPRCEVESGRCLGCADDSDCRGQTEDGHNLTICTESGACTECTGSRYDACGLNDRGAALVCDTEAGRCTHLAEGQASLCASCVSDAHCPKGARCVAEEVDGQQYGYVCLHEVGDEGVLDCLGSARPYVKKRPQVTSIDGEVVDVCGLRLSSCKAQREHSAPVAECDADHNGGACGEADVEDALCRSPEDEAAYRCVMPCASSDDCKRGFACNDQQPAFCDFAPNTCYADTDCEKPTTCDLGSHRCR